MTTDLFGTAVWQSTRRRRPRWGGWLVIAAIAAALSVGSTQLARRPEAVALTTALGLDRGVELGEIVGSPLPRRFLVAAGGVAMRASLPEVITAGTRAAIELELWTADGAPLAAPEAVVTVVRPDGGVRGLGAPSIGPGHYRFQSSFAKPGRYLLQVFVLDGDATLAVPFEVSAPRGTVQVEEAVKTHLAGP